MNKIFVGLDVSSKSFSMACINEEGKVILKTKSFRNSPQGASSALSSLLSIIPEGTPCEISIGTESTSFYDFHLANFFSSCQELQNHKVSVRRVNPLRINRFRKALHEIHKTDKSDPIIIAEFLRMGKNLPPPHNPSDPYAPLRSLTRFRVHLVNAIVREVNFLLSNLFLYLSEFASQKPLKVSSKTSLALIEELSPEEIAEKSVEEIVELLTKNGKGRFREPERIAETIKYLTRESFRIRAELARSVHFVLINSIRNIRAFKESLKEVSRAIREEMKAFPNTLGTVPGIGEILSAGIIAEIGDIGRFERDDQIAKLAGLVWGRFQSGGFEGEERRMIKSANKYLRYYICEAANSVRRNVVQFSNYYWKKYKESRSNHHKRALVLTARKFIRLVFNLLKEGKIFRPEGSSAEETNES